MTVVGSGLINIGKLLGFHRNHGKTVALTAVLQDENKGILDIRKDGSVQSFREKKDSDVEPGGVLLY